MHGSRSFLRRSFRSHLHLILIYITLLYRYQRGETISFPLYGVMQGWSEGLMLMKVGGKAKLTIPFDLAYGERGDGLNIPPKATLVFTMELLAIDCNSLLECALESLSQLEE
jgi:hypothetical protein